MACETLVLVPAEETPEQRNVRQRMRRHTSARKRAERLAAQEAELIREAVALGIPQTYIAADLDRSREWVRLTLDPTKRRRA